jgi:serine/threonine protein kinase
MMQRLRRELRIWGNLNHPNIVSLLGVTSDFGKTSMVCQWMSQGTLSDYLEKEMVNLNLQQRLNIVIINPYLCIVGMQN